MRARFWAVACILALTGCATQTAQRGWVQPPIAIPLQSTLQQELQLARTDQLLQRTDLDEVTRAQIHFERGMLHDSLGLRDLARLDFNQSLQIKPDQPDVFNILGVYFTQSGHFDAAYEAFDSVLELKEGHAFAQRNRGIALYYGQRYQLATEDLLAHYAQNPDDPYRTIWLYLTELEIDPVKANADMRKRYDVADRSQWGWEIVAMYLDDLSEVELLNQVARTSEGNVELAQKLCEIYFYMAKRYQHRGDEGSAISLYKMAMAGNVYEYIEHRYAMLELSTVLQNRM
ncbi:lipoprotein NlpI [Thaumasiovibrio subtropicus]|uniref:lipoprotein NlpI n=1 Tax=Thaumasiovibrio subtropicus TaxID=1891207 RepID=UPI000B35BCEB|nr:lipoprotein NlpI [Thaumasiovibrio subtropicus]